MTRTSPGGAWFWKLTGERGREMVAAMKKAFLTLSLIPLCLAAHAASNVGNYYGTWSEGTRSGRFALSFLSDGIVTVTRHLGTNGFNQVDSLTGSFTTGKTGLRTFVIQTGTNGMTGTVFNGAVRAKSKNFLTGETGTLQAAPASNAAGL